MSRKASVYTVFGEYYHKDADAILGELRPRCPDVDFVGLDTFSQIATVLEKIRAQKERLDGILVFGPYYDRALTAIGLPVIMVNSVLRFSEWVQGISHYYRGERLLTSTLCAHDLQPSLTAARFDELAGKINLLAALRRVRNSRILNIEAEDNTLQRCEQKADAPDDYQKVFFDHLDKFFGLGIKTVMWHDFYKEIERADDAEASGIADRWIQEAEEVKETTREEIVKVAKLYLAARKLMRQFDCVAFTVRSWSESWWNVKIMPPLAEMELSKEHKVASCESLFECLLTQILALYIAGRPSFVGDTLGIDPANDVVIYGHCFAPINPHGNDRVPYTIRSHVLHSPSPGIRVEFPLHETVTVAKISVYYKKVAVYTGEVVSGREIYKDFDDIACRSKIVIKTDARAMSRNYDWSTFGIHRVVFYGDYREKFKELATLIGFEIVEEDK